MIIKKVKAKKIKNSRNEDTIKIIIKSDNGKFEASAPSGSSMSEHEVRAISTKGIKYSIDFANKILNKRIKTIEFNQYSDFEKIESLLKEYDQSKNWEIIGGNTIIALEFAILKAASKGRVWKFLNPKIKQVPRPLGNCIGGGKHIKREKKPDIQEFLLFSFNAKKYSDAVNANKKIHLLLEKELKKIDKDFEGELSDEGAWAPNLNAFEILDLIDRVVKDFNDENSMDVKIGMDIAASSLYDGKYYCYNNFSNEQKIRKLTRKEQIEFVVSLVEKYNLGYVEDPMNENDFYGFNEIKKRVGNKCLICGDDLIATNPERLEIAIQKKSINSVIVKPNQIGSLVKVKEIIEMAKKNNIYPIISHRSGETMDAIIAHLAVGFNCPMIKTGIYGKERVVKLDEIKKIENEIRKEA